jgi:hypothetical protein
MQVSGATALNALIQGGLRNSVAPSPKPAQQATAAAPVAGKDSDGDSDGSGSVGTRLNVKA